MREQLLDLVHGHRSDSSEASPFIIQIADYGDVEIITVEDAGEATIGKKRNICMALAAGDYVCAIDDDDLISGTYFTDILRALEKNPDCVGFMLKRTVDGRPEWDAEHSLKHQRYNFVWRTQKSGGVVRVAVRPPNHLNPIRREIALKSFHSGKKELWRRGHGFRPSDLVITQDGSFHRQDALDYCQSRYAGGKIGR